MNMRGAVLMAGLVGLAGAACSATDRDGAGTTVVDSAGVRVVQHDSLTAPTWLVPPTALVSLGTLDGEGPESFFRVSSAVRSENGTITVFNAGSTEARQFTSSGEFVRTIGRQGQGPGEFMGVARMRVLSDDRIAIWDTRARRLSLFDATGELERVITPEGIERRPQLITVLDDGSTLFQQEIIQPESPTELRQNYANYILWGPNGEVLDTLPRQEHVEVILWGEGPLVGPPIFGSATEYAGDAGGYWIGGQKHTDLVHYGLDGAVDVIVRWPDSDRSVGSDAADLWVEEQLQGVTDPAVREQRIVLYRGTPVADRFPAYGDLFVDRVGLLWVQEYERPGRTDPSRWWVFDGQGMLLGEVRLPLGSRLFDAGDDYLLVGRTDDLGVEYVDLLSLTRSSA